MIKNKSIIIAHNWSDSFVNLQSKHLALKLSENNHVVFLDAGTSKKKGYRECNNLKIHPWPGKRPTGIKDFLFAAKIMYHSKPDVVITHFAANNIMLLVAKLFRVPVRICYYHTMVAQYIADHGKLPFRQRLNIFRKGFFFRTATHMLPCSTAAKRDLEKYYRIAPSKAVVFPNALPDTKFRNTNNDLSIGFLGRLTHSKGADILVRAFGIVIEALPNIKLYIAGAGNDIAQLQSLVRQLGLEESVIFKSGILHRDVGAFLSSLYVLVVPSRVDNLPTVAIEALATGTPVIGSDSGGIPDIITNGYNGLLFAHGSEEDLSMKILELYKDPRERDQMAINARRSFKEKYSLEQLEGRFEALINAD